MKKSRIKYIFILFLIVAIVKGVSLANGLITATASNSNFYVGYGIRDLSPTLSNYNDTEKANPDMPVVSDCNSQNQLGNGNSAVNPVPLGGFGTVTLRAKSTQCNDADSHIKTTVVSFKDNDNNYVVLLSADFSAFNSTTNSNDFYVSKIRTNIVNYIQEKLGIKLASNRIMLSSTHNHSGPSYSFNSESMKAYTAFMQRKINEAVEDSLRNMKKSNITYDTFEVFVDEEGNIQPDTYTGSKRFLNYNRHYTTDNYVYPNGRELIVSSGRSRAFKCNGANHTDCENTLSLAKLIGHKRDADHDIQVIKIQQEGETKPILMLNWQAHPNTLGNSQSVIISADYVGYMRGYLEKKGYNVSYYQGGAGDIHTRSYVANNADGTNPDTFYIDGHSVMTGASNANTATGITKTKKSIQAIGNKLGELVDDRIASNKYFKNTVKYKNGIAFYQEENKTEAEANKIEMFLRNWDDKDSKGNYLYNVDIYANAFFLSKIAEVTEAEANGTSTDLTRIINGDYTKNEWAADWEYVDRNGKTVSFTYPKSLGTTPATVSDKLISIIRQYNGSFFNNMFKFEKNSQGVYKLVGYDPSLDASKITTLIEIIGIMMDDLTTPDLLESFCNTAHANVIKGIYTRVDKSYKPVLNTFAIGNLGFVTAPYEMFSSNAKYIKENSPFGVTFVLAYSNGGYYGYLPDKETFGYGSYETDITLFVEGTAEKNAETFVNRLNTLYDWSTTDWYSSYTYTLSSNEITLTKYNGNEEIVYVPSTATINNKTYQTKIFGEVFKDNRNIKYVQFEDGIKAATSLKDLFRDCANLIEVKFNNIDTTSVTDMSYMFFECYKLTSVDINKLNTSKVTNMHGMFTMCISLTELSLINFDTSKVTDMQSMFYGCSKLESLNLSSFNTVSVTNFISMFHGCTSLKSLNLGSFNTSNATNMYRMFYGCSNLETVTVSSLWNTSKVTNSAEMFGNASKIKGGNGTVYDSTKIDKTYARIDKSGAKGYFTNLIVNYKYTKDDTNKKITLTEYTGNEESIIVPAKVDDYDIIISGGVYNGNTTVKYVTFEDGVKAGTSLQGLFKDCTNLITVNLGNFNTSNVTDMSYMFYGDKNLISLDLSKLNTSKVTNMHGMFAMCSKLTELSLTNFDTSKVTDMQSMFYGCSLLTSLNLSSFNTISVVNFVSMFHGCASLTSLDLSSFNISVASNINMKRMFYSCSNLETITVSSLWNTSKVTTSTEMFGEATKLKGGNGTIYDSTKVDKTYARIDRLGEKGYFTLSQEQMIVLATNVPTSTYVVGQYMFTRNTNSNYDGKVTTKRIMLASKSITGNSESDMVIYYKKPTGEWIDALTGSSITVPTSFIIEVTDLDKILTIDAEAMTTNQYTSSNIDPSTYVIGKYMFTRNTNSNYNGVLTTKRIMLASKSITGNSESDMVIYYKKPTGEWIDAIASTELTAPSKFNIGVIDLVKQ